MTLDNTHVSIAINWFHTYKGMEKGLWIVPNVIRQEEIYDFAANHSQQI